MMVVVSYDVSTIDSSGRRRLRHVSRQCLNYGQRVQNSVFECIVDSTQWELLKGKLLHIFDPEQDSLRFYYLGANWTRHREHHGAKPSLDLDGPLIA